jgi:hypothetical protein
LAQLVSVVSTSSSRSDAGGEEDPWEVHSRCQQLVEVFFIIYLNFSKNEFKYILKIKISKKN